MNVMKLIVLTLNGISFFSLNARAQAIENIIAENLGNQIIVTYDLAGPVTGLKVLIEIFCSVDTYSHPVEGADGDLGKISPGKNKKIVITPGPLLENYNGNLLFEVVGQVVEDFKLQIPVRMKRGKRATVTWSGGLTSDPIKLELVDKSMAVISFAETANIKAYSFLISKSIPIGKGYVVRLTSGEEKTVSTPFKIKRRLGRGWLAVPLLLASGSVTYLLNISQDLPEPPGPPGPD